MLIKCAKAVRNAAKQLGREGLTDADLKSIEDRMSDTMRRLARTDPDWQGYSQDMRVSLAAEQAIADIRAEADRKAANAVRQVVATAAVETQVQGLQASFKGTRAQALRRHFELTDLYDSALRRDAQGGLMNLIEAAGDKQGAGLGRRFLMAVFDAENPAMTRDVVREIFKNADGFTGNTVAKGAARAWLDTIEGLRLRFNAAGGDVGKLEYGYTPQPHDRARIAKAGRDVWVDKTLPLLDRSRYVLEDGSRMGDAEVKRMLGVAWETITTDGVSKQDPGSFRGTGARANRGSDARQVHFADGEAWTSYMTEFGRGSLYDSMMGHIAGMSRDIALVERYGPDIQGTARLQFDLAARADGMKPENLAHWNEIDPHTYWNMITGKTGAPVDETLAQAFQTLRNVQTAGKLGAAVISSVTDLGTLAITAGYNRLPYWQLVKDIGGQASKETRDWMASHGMIAESVANSLNRWSGDHIGNNWSGKLANSVMRWSLMNAWTNGLRQGFTLTMNAKLGEMSRMEWGALSEFDRSRFARAGITEADWKVLQAVPLENFKGRDLLTPQGIKDMGLADFEKARPEELAALRQRITDQTAELTTRNAQEQQWISGRLDKFDAARDGLNRAVKELRDKKLAGNEKATEPLLQRMALLDAQREQAKLQGDLETDFNRLVTQDEMRAFLNAVEDGASADLTAVGPAKKAVRAGLEAAESSGRRYGERKGALQRRMQEMENRIAEMDRHTSREVNAAAKEAQAKADAMAAELADFVKRSQERQGKRTAVIERLQAEQSERLGAEADRVKRDLAARVFGLIADESEYAVVNPNLASRAVLTMGGKEAGTWAGEIARTVTQFKSFPVAMFTRHWDRMLEGNHGAEGAPLLANRGVYGFALMATLTGLGAVAVQEKQILQGKDPIDMEKPRFWAKALLQGGGVGIAGDLFLVDPSSSTGDAVGTFVKNLAGPTVGTATELISRDLVENIWQAAAGKDTHWAAELASTLKSNVPGATVWWAKPVIDHGFINALNESMSPGYLSRMQQRAAKDWNQRFWWAPKDTTPQRAPDMGAALP